MSQIEIFIDFNQVFLTQCPSVETPKSKSATGILKKLYILIKFLINKILETV